MGGSFTEVAPGGSPLPAARIASWDGLAWSTVGAGLSSIVRDMVTWDDGGGSDLYLTGSFPTESHVTRWDGAAWQAPAAPR